MEACHMIQTPVLRPLLRDQLAGYSMVMIRRKPYEVAKGTPQYSGSVVTSVSLTKDFHSEIREAAIKEGRSFSNMICILAKRGLNDPWNSRNAYLDCYDLLDRALDEPRGIRVQLTEVNDATYLRMRIHHARTIDRSDNKKTYPDLAHPLHDRSPYDALVCRIEEANGSTFLWLDKQKVEILGIEAIPADARIEFTEPKALAPPEPQAEIVIESPVVIEPLKQISHIRRR